MVSTLLTFAFFNASDLLYLFPVPEKASSSSLHAQMTSLQQHMPWRPHAKPPPPEIEIEFAQQLRNPQMAYRKLSASPVRSSSEAVNVHRTGTPKSPSSPSSFLGFGSAKGCMNTTKPFNIPCCAIEKYFKALLYIFVRGAKAQIREQMSGPDLHVLTLKFVALKKPGFSPIKILSKFF